MSLYRQTGRGSGRTLALASVAALVVGLIGGFALGRGTAPEPTLADKVSDLRDQLAPAREGVQLAPTEYAQAVRGGRVVAATEYAAAQSDVKRARDAVDASGSDLRALDPAKAAALEQAVTALEAAVARKASPAEVRVRSARADAALSAVVGSSS